MAFTRSVIRLVLQRSFRMLTHSSLPAPHVLQPDVRAVRGD